MVLAGPPRPSPCLLRPAEARQLRWRDVQIFDGSLSTRYEKVYGIVHIKEPRTRRTTGHATQQRVLLEFPGICSLINNMKASISDHELDTAIWKFTAAQHFAFRSLGVSHQQKMLHGLRGGGATGHLLQYRDLPQIRRRGRWTSERTLERYIQQGTFLLRALADLAPFLCKTGLRKACRGIRSFLRSGVEQQGFANSVSPLGALPLSLSDVGR